MKLPPNHSVVVQAKLVGDTKFPPGPMLMEGTNRLKEMGLQLVDEFIQLPDTTTNASTKVLLTNSLGITQRVDEGTEVGVALPAEIVSPVPEPTRVLIPGNEETPTLNPDAVL